VVWLRLATKAVEAYKRIVELMGLRILSLDYRFLDADKYISSIESSRFVRNTFLPIAFTVAPIVAGILAYKFTPSSNILLTPLLYNSMLLAVSLAIIFSAIALLAVIVNGVAGDNLVLTRRDVEEVVRRRDLLETTTIVFSIVTRGDWPWLAARAAESIRYWVSRVSEKYGLKLNTVIEIVSDSYSRILEEVADRLVVVPASYRTRRGARYKARALQYAVEKRVADGLVGENVWVFHLDEESIVGEDTILGLLRFIVEAKDRGYVMGCGELLASNGIISTPISLVDFQRSFYTLVFQGFTYAKLHRPYLGLIGNNYVVNSLVEAEIGYDCGPFESLAEDSWFALRVYERYGARVGWIKSRVFEEPVYSLKDMLRQRSRWYIGTVANALSKTIGFKAKAAYIVMTIYWTIAPLGILPTLATVIVTGALPSDPLLASLAVSALTVFMELYMLGAWRTLAPHPIPRLNKLLAVVAVALLTPLLLALEGLGVVYAWIKPATEFYIVAKGRGQTLENTL